MFDEDRAARVVRFFERHLRHSKGAYFGKPFVPSWWQEQILRDIFGTVDAKGRRRYRRAYIEVPKKNGKSELAAGIALYMLLADGEPGAEVYSAAATREQASIVFRTAVAMVRQSPLLSSMVKIVESTKTMYSRSLDGSMYRALSADAGSHDGVNPHAVIFDELHRQKKRDLWNILTYGADVREQPLVFAITTAGVREESELCWEQHEYARRIIEGSHSDSQMYARIYGLDPDEDWTKEGKPGILRKDGRWRRKPTGWYKANPSLQGNPGGFVPIESVRQAFREAQTSPAEQAAFRRFRLNQWGSREQRWLDMADWDRCGKGIPMQELAGKTCFGGLDLSTTIDLTAFVLAFEIDDRIVLLPKFWIPEEGIESRSSRDGVPYASWAAQGLIEATPGSVVDYERVRRYINEISSTYELARVGYDPWNAVQLATQLREVDGIEMTPIRQGFGSLSAPSKMFESLVKAGKLEHGGNPVLRWMADSVTVATDPAGNIKPVKPDRTKSKVRIDGIVAAVMAIDCWQRTLDRAPMVLWA